MQVIHCTLDSYPMPKGHWNYMGKKHNKKLCFLQAIYLQCTETYFPKYWKAVETEVWICYTNLSFNYNKVLLLGLQT